MGVSKFEPKVEGEGVDVSPHKHNLPGFLMIRDVDGLRHAIRFGSVQLVSDGDPCCDSTVVVVAGRALFVDQPLDEVLAQIVRPTPVGMRGSYSPGYARNEGSSL